VSVAQAAEGQSGQRANVDSTDMGEAAVRQALEAMIDRGVHMMLVFTGGVNHVYNYYGQLFDLLPGLDFRKQLRLEYMPETDHTVSDAAGRGKLLASVGEWLRQSFPGRGTASTDGDGGDARAASARAGTSAWE
jgi:hypothetical protein